MQHIPKVLHLQFSLNELDVEAVIWLDLKVTSESSKSTTMNS